MKHNFSQKEMAKKIGIDISSLNVIENGHRNMSKKTRAKIYKLIEADY